MTSRCLVYAELEEDFDANHDANQEIFWRKVADSFTKAKLLIEQMVKESGIDLSQVDCEEIEKEQAAKDAKIRRMNLTNLTEYYAGKTGEFVENEKFCSFVESEHLEDFFQIIAWYHHFISAKIYRALASQNDEFEEYDDFPSDADGSAKIALIAVDRSIYAWHALLNENNSARINSQISLLEKIRRAAEEKFPNARNFIRPGFDEIEIVM